MRSLRRRWLDFICVFLTLGALGALYLAWRYTERAQVSNGNPALDRFTALGTAASAIGSFSAFLLLVFYTRETYLLRKRSEDQVEIQIRPVVILWLDISTPTGSYLEDPLQFRNVGPGPAFNVAASTIADPPREYQLEAVSVLLPNQTTIALLRMADMSVSQSAIQARACLGYDLAARSIRFAVTYSSASGRRYRSICELNYDDRYSRQRMSTQLVRVEDVEN
jgi:hypothetical protein